MISAQLAAEIEAKLVRLLGVGPDEVRDYFKGNIKAGEGRRTGYRWVHGSHSGAYVADPEGTDILPDGYEAPTY